MLRNTCYRYCRQACAGVLLAQLWLLGCQPDGQRRGAAGPAQSQSGGPPAAVEKLPEVGQKAAQRRIGLYRYMADAAVFRDCADGRLYPVLIEAGHLPLERAYLEQRGEPGAEVLAEFEAEVTMRAPEPGMPEREHLRVTRFIELRPGEACSDQSG